MTRLNGAIQKSSIKPEEHSGSSTKVKKAERLTFSINKVYGLKTKFKIIHGMHMLKYRGYIFSIEQI